MKRTSEKTCKKIVELYQNDISVQDIMKTLSVGKTTVFKTLNRYHVPKRKKRSFKQQIKKEVLSFVRLLSLRLLYFCDDYELLADMLNNNAKASGAKKIYVSERIFDFVDSNKVKKIVSIAQLNCEIELRRKKII